MSNITAKRQLLPQKYEEALHRRRAGQSITQIAEAMEIGLTTAWQYIRNADGDYAPPTAYERISPQQWAEFEEKRMECSNFCNAAKAVGISYKNASKYMYEVKNVLKKQSKMPIQSQDYSKILRV